MLEAVGFGLDVAEEQGAFRIGAWSVPGAVRPPRRMAVTGLFISWVRVWTYDSTYFRFSGHRAFPRGRDRATGYRDRTVWERARWPRRTALA